MPPPSKKPTPASTIHPRYADSFRCIGTACEDTCCQTWNIPIDKGTYQKYHGMPDGPLRTIVEHSVERTGKPGDWEYARIKLDANGECPFLAEDHLCSIQKEHGESFLSATCSQYPRVFRRIDDIEERTLLLSCPEAARLVLLHPRLVPMGESDRPTDSHYYDFLVQLAHAPLQEPTEMPYFSLIRHFVLLLLQDRSYPLWQRMFLLNMFCKRLETLVARLESNRVPTLLREHAEMIATGKLRTALQTMRAQTVVQLGIVMAMLERRGTSINWNRRFVECLEDFANGIGYRDGRTAADLVQNYIDAYDRYYRPGAAEHESMLENYLLNYVFSHVFPFGKARLYPYRESQILCFQFGLIKGLLIGMAGYHQSSFGSDQVVKLIQSFSKSSEHHTRLVQQIESFFETNELNDTNGMAALLRDGETEAPAQAPVVTTQALISPL